MTVFVMELLLNQVMVAAEECVELPGGRISDIR